jgi:CheY-like chemotaxis protein
MRNFSNWRMHDAGEAPTTGVDRQPIIRCSETCKKPGGLARGWSRVLRFYPAPRVLVVDDDPQFRELTRSLLSCLGIASAEAENGCQALAYLKAHAGETQAVVVDVVMPESDGLEVLREIRRSFHGLKVLVVSGADDGDLYLHISSSLGADAVLPKSRVELLLTVVRDFLSE